MTNSFLDGTGRGRRAAVILIVAVSVLALVTAATALVLLTGRHTGTAPTTPRPNATVEVPSGPLTQIKGEWTIEGISVGYPHTAAGAISAASEYAAQLGSTLDFDRVRTVARVVADSSYADAPDRVAQARINSRKVLGLPETGPIPAGASMTVGPAAFQLRSVTSDQMTVLLLSYVTTTDAVGKIASKVIVQPVDVRWSGGDWKLLAPGASADTNFTSLLAQPGTADAAAKGWQVITP